jgi:3-deoxy-D-manno-octulosonate 8-phosphate phosphatase (KDO 8-P phosphatase)
LTLAERCRGIELLVADVDGVLTDGGIVLGSPQLELKRFHVRDGSALAWWRQLGKRAALLTGRRSPLVGARAAELGVDLVVQGAADKGRAYADLLRRCGLPPRAACYVGDDLPDLAPLADCGLAVAVADACPEARAAAHYVTGAGGGRGAVREVVELVLRCQGLWQGLVERQRGGMSM